MTNEEKIEILLSAKYGNVKEGDNVWFSKQYQNDFGLLLEMSQWKEKQMIEKSCEWLKENSGLYLYRELSEYDMQYYARIDRKKMIIEFKRAMEE